MWESTWDFKTRKVSHAPRSLRTGALRDQGEGGSSIDLLCGCVIVWKCVELSWRSAGFVGKTIKYIYTQKCLKCLLHKIKIHFQLYQTHLLSQAWNSQCQSVACDTVVFWGGKHKDKNRGPSVLHLTALDVSKSCCVMTLKMEGVHTGVELTEGACAIKTHTFCWKATHTGCALAFRDLIWNRTEWRGL